jgi:hypothetical protein
MGGVGGVGGGDSPTPHDGRQGTFL